MFHYQNTGKVKVIPQYKQEKLTINWEIKTDDKNHLQRSNYKDHALERRIKE